MLCVIQPVLDMSVKEKTYTFRASADLALRTRDAFHTWGQLLAQEEIGAGDPFRDAVTRLCIALGRRARSSGGLDNQSELFRSLLEEFIDATERAAEDVQFIRAYEEWAREDEEG